jgi:hypothetical protein
MEGVLGKNPIQVETTLKAWMKSGLLFEQSYHNSETKSDAMGLYVEESKRPSR